MRHFYDQVREDILVDNRKKIAHLCHTQTKLLFAHLKIIIIMIIIIIVIRIIIVIKKKRLLCKATGAARCRFFVCFKQ